MKQHARRVIGVAVVGVALVVAAQALAATPSHEVAVSSFATGFKSTKGIGPVGLAFGGGDLYVAAGASLYRFTSAGGDASANRVGSVPGADLIGGLAFGPDGSLYAARWHKDRTGDIVQLEPNTGLVLRTVAGGLRCPAGLAVDPVSGDLFVSELSCGKDVLRISGGHATPVLTGLEPDGLSFGPDGTLYVAHAPDASGYTISSVSRNGTRTGISKISSTDGIAVSSTSSRGVPDFLLVNRTDGTITRIELGDDRRHPARNLVTGGTRGDFVVVGPDACLYATQTSEVLKVTNPDGGCQREATAGNVASGLGAGLSPTLPAPPPPVGSTSRARSTVACAAKRSLRLRYRPRGRASIARARLYVRGRYVRTVSGRGLARGVTLRSPGAARFTVTIRAVTTKRHRLTVRKRYGLCTNRSA